MLFAVHGAAGGAGGDDAGGAGDDGGGGLMTLSSTWHSYPFGIAVHMP